MGPEADETPVRGRIIPYNLLTNLRFYVVLFCVSCWCSFSFSV